VKRLAITLGYLLVGIAVTWFLAQVVTVYLAAHIPSRAERCGDIGQCDVSWWTSAAFFALFLGPAVAYGVGGFMMGKAPIKPIARHLGVMCGLFAGTLALYALVQFLV
jgi:hypothetical protein